MVSHLASGLHMLLRRMNQGPQLCSGVTFGCPLSALELPTSFFFFFLWMTPIVFQNWGPAIHVLIPLSMQVLVTPPIINKQKRPVAVSHGWTSGSWDGGIAQQSRKRKILLHTLSFDWQNLRFPPEPSFITSSCSLDAPSAFISTPSPPWPLYYYIDWFTCQRGSEFVTSKYASSA